jgi:Ran GTPase-activating protein (RanGAP) involved in mRNA processing and transport
VADRLGCDVPSLSGNLFGPEFAIALAKALLVNGRLTSLNLSNNHLCGLAGRGRGTYTAEGITAIAGAMRVNGSLTVTNLLGNELDAESAKMLAEFAKQKGISLCGIQRDQTIADFHGQGLQPPEAILLVSDLSQAVVTGGLTALDLSYNCLEDEGVSAVCKAIQNNKETKLASLNFKNNGIGPVGANAVAAMVAVTGALTEVLAF